MLPNAEHSMEENIPDLTSSVVGFVATTGKK